MTIDAIPEPIMLAPKLGTSQCRVCERVCKSRDAYRKHYAAEHLLQAEA